MSRASSPLLGNYTRKTKVGMEILCFLYWSILVSNITFNICNTKNVLCGNFLLKNLSQDCFVPCDCELAWLARADKTMNPTKYSKHPRENTQGFMFAKVQVQ